MPAPGSGTILTKGTTTLDREGGTPFIQRILPRHFAIIDMVVAGHDVETIAETLGISKMSLNIIMKSPLFQVEVERRRTEAREGETIGLDRNAVAQKARSILEQAAEKAAMKHLEVMTTGNPSVQLKAAGAILDRVFGPAGGQAGGPAIVVNVSAEQVALLNVALKESYHGSRSVPAANSPTAVDSEEQRQGDVLEGSEECSGDVGCGSAEGEGQREVMS